MRIFCLLAALALTFPAGAARAQSPWTAPPKDLQAAKDFLGGALRDPNTTDLALASLRLTGDAGLTALYVAYSSNPDRRVRLVSCAALSDLKGDAAIAALQERVKSDPVMAIRAQAIALLIQWKASTSAQLQEAMKSEDEKIQYLAARGLVSAGQGRLAADQLAKLAGSNDPFTAGLARLDLLSLGRVDQLAPLTLVLVEPNSPPDLTTMLLGRIQEDKITAAAGIVETVSLSAPSEEVRLNAFRAVAAISTDAGKRLMDGLAKAEGTRSTVLLFRMIAGLKDPQASLQALAQGKNLAGALARLELARPAKDATSAQAAAEVAAYGHPLILEHLLGCLQDDLAKDANTPARLDVYTPLLLDIVRKTPKGGPRLGLDQEVAGRAATLLADIGTPWAMAGLKEVLAGPFGEAKRAAIGGLVRTKNPAAAALAKPVMESPYPELAATSAIALARKGDKDAAKPLGDIISHSNRYSPDLVVMVSWYALKLGNAHEAALQEFIKAAK
jgi:hypothetical protein